MQAIREIVNRDIFSGYDVPKELGDRFEMILVPLSHDMLGNSLVGDSGKNGDLLMRYQSENGFSKNILAQESEDVWNDI